MPKELVDLRWDMLNKRRHNKKNMIIKQREKIIMQEMEIQERGGAYNSLMNSSNQFGAVNSSVSNPMFVNNSNPNYEVKGSGQVPNISNSQAMS